MDIVLEYNSKILRVTFYDHTTIYSIMTVARHELGAVFKESNSTMVLVTFNNGQDQTFIPEIIEKIVNLDTLQETAISADADPQNILFNELENLIV